MRPTKSRLAFNYSVTMAAPVPNLYVLIMESASLYTRQFRIRIDIENKLQQCLVIAKTFLINSVYDYSSLLNV